MKIVHLEKPIFSTFFMKYTLEYFVLPHHLCYDTRVTPSVLLRRSSMSVGLGVLDTHTMEDTVFPKTFALIIGTLLLSSDLIGPPGLYQCAHEFYQEFIPTFPCNNPFFIVSTFQGRKLLLPSLMLSCLHRRSSTSSIRLPKRRSWRSIVVSRRLSS